MAAAEKSETDKRRGQKNNPMHSSAGGLPCVQPIAPESPVSADPFCRHVADAKLCEEKSKNDPLHSSISHWSKGLAAFAAAARCGAKRRAGGLCQSPAMENGRCRMHGGASPGAPLRNRNALKHGETTAEGLLSRRLLRDVIRSTSSVVAAAENAARETRLHRFAVQALLRARATAIHLGTEMSTREPDA